MKIFATWVLMTHLITELSQSHPVLYETHILLTLFHPKDTYFIISLAAFIINSLPFEYRAITGPNRLRSRPPQHSHNNRPALTTNNTFETDVPLSFHTRAPSFVFSLYFLCDISPSLTLPRLLQHSTQSPALLFKWPNLPAAVVICQSVSSLKLPGSAPCQYSPSPKLLSHTGAISSKPCPILRLRLHLPGLPIRYLAMSIYSY